jgi:hypothetical protein
MLVRSAIVCFVTRAEESDECIIPTVPLRELKKPKR